MLYWDCAYVCIGSDKLRKGGKRLSDNGNKSQYFKKSGSTSNKASPPLKRKRTGNFKTNI